MTIFYFKLSGEIKQPDANTAPVLETDAVFAYPKPNILPLLNFNGESENAYSEALGMDCVSLVLVAAASAASTWESMTPGMAHVHQTTNPIENPAN